MDFTLTNNEFLRQFEISLTGSKAIIEYSQQDKKIFLTKLTVPSEIDSSELRDSFIRLVFNSISEKNLRIVPTSPAIAKFLRTNKKEFKDLLPVGIKL